MSGATGTRTIGRVPFVDGITRDVFEDAAGPQFVLDGDGGEKVYGVWMVPADEPVVGASRAPPFPAPAGVGHIRSARGSPYPSPSGHAGGGQGTVP